MRVITLLLVLFSLPVIATGQAPSFPGFTGWDIDATGRVMQYLNRPALYLERGIALMPGATFADGTIEFDVAIHGHSGFAGVVFRGASPDDYELIYLRTHRSRQWDALQYTPMFAGQEAWQLYTGDGYNGVAELPANRWVHVKVVVDGYEAHVFVDNAATPQLTITDLKRPWARGRVGLWGRSGAATFSNFKVTPVDRSVPPARPASVPGAGVIARWSISQSFVAASVAPGALPSTLTWETVPVESSGLVNIARYRRPAVRSATDRNDDRRDTVFAKIVLRAAQSQRVRVSFGYSDDVTVFLDGRPLFSGQGGYLLRDGSFLGTMTLGPDAIYLELAAGRHELVFAVTEAFGGWGVAAKIDAGSGITIE